jgi:hypothetical protein
MLDGVLIVGTGTVRLAQKLVLLCQLADCRVCAIFMLQDDPKKTTFSRHPVPEGVVCVQGVTPRIVPNLHI